jgi:hypothetical protein
MSELARANGWRGFDGIGERTTSGYWYRCDGMPSMAGCSHDVVITRRWSTIGKKKKSGWVVMYGEDFDGVEDIDVVLAFCPTCAAVVTAQQQRGAP